MKKFFMVAVMAVAALSASAQVYVGGQVGLDFEKNKATDNTSTTFQIAPEVGYNINENWAVGMELGYQSYNNGAKNADTESAFTIAPYARYTFANTGNVSFFVDGAVGYKTYNNDGGNTFQVGLRPGLKVAASKKVDFVATLGYLGYAKDSDERGGNSRYGFNVDNSAVNFGVYFNF